MISSIPFATAIARTSVSVFGIPLSISFLGRVAETWKRVEADLAVNWWRKISDESRFSHITSAKVAGHTASFGSLLLIEHHSRRVAYFQ